MPGPLVPGMTAFAAETGLSRSCAPRLSRRRFGVGDNVTRLILTSSNGMGLVKTGRADVVVPFPHRFVWGPLSSEDELAFYMAARSPKHGPGEHWSDFGMWSQSSDAAADEADEDLSLIEFCKHCESVELWFDPNPEDQLLLIWLLNCFKSHPEIAAKLRLAVADFDLLGQRTEDLASTTLADC